MGRIREGGDAPAVRFGHYKGDKRADGGGEEGGDAHRGIKAEVASACAAACGLQALQQSLAAKPVLAATSAQAGGGSSAPAHKEDTRATSTAASAISSLLRPATRVVLPSIFSALGQSVAGVDQEPARGDRDNSTGTGTGIAPASTMGPAPGIGGGAAGTGPSSSASSSSSVVRFTADSLAAAAARATSITSSSKSTARIARNGTSTSCPAPPTITLFPKPLSAGWPWTPLAHPGASILRAWLPASASASASARGIGSIAVDMASLLSQPSASSRASVQPLATVTLSGDATRAAAAALPLASVAPSAVVAALDAAYRAAATTGSTGSAGASTGADPGPISGAGRARPVLLERVALDVTFPLSTQRQAPPPSHAGGSASSSTGSAPAASLPAPLRTDAQWVRLVDLIDVDLQALASFATGEPMVNIPQAGGTSASASDLESMLVEDPIMSAAWTVVDRWRLPPAEALLPIALCVSQAVNDLVAAMCACDYPALRASPFYAAALSATSAVNAPVSAASTAGAGSAGGATGSGAAGSVVPAVPIPSQAPFTLPNADLIKFIGAVPRGLSIVPPPLGAYAATASAPTAAASTASAAAAGVDALAAGSVLPRVKLDKDGVLMQVDGLTSGLSAGDGTVPTAQCVSGGYAIGTVPTAMAHALPDSAVKACFPIQPPAS